MKKLKTGILGLDSLLDGGFNEHSATIVVGSAGTGKTTIGVDTMINQARINKQNASEAGFRPVYNIYVAVGQKQSNIARVIAELEKAGAMEYTTVISSPPRALVLFPLNLVAVSRNIDPTSVLSRYRHSPGLKSPNVIGPTFTRTRRSTG